MSSAGGDMHYAKLYVWGYEMSFCVQKLIILLNQKKRSTNKLCVT
jgi:hypothetical protein